MTRTEQHRQEMLSSYIILVVVLLHRCIWATSLADVRNLRMVPANAIDQTAIVRIDEFDVESTDMTYFESTENVIIVNKTNSVLIHHTKLNSAARVGGIPYELPQDTEVDENTWFEFRSENRTTKLGPRFPLTPCLNSNHGDGGSLTGTFSKTFGQKASLDLPFGFDLSFLSLSVDYMTSVATSVQISGMYGCTVSANSTGQLFIQPYLVEIYDPKYRKVKVHQRRSWRNPSSRKPSYIEVEEWQSYKSTIRLSSFTSKPIFTCVTDPRYLTCDSGLTDEAYVFS